MGLILARFTFRLYAAKPQLKFWGVFCLSNRRWLFQLIQHCNHSLLFFNWFHFHPPFLASF
uniref:Uncharacterized protein n=1 Tax=Siphoviridae sp. ctHMI2 TaxID=2826231 RepID=A0A8S5MKM0_9CAUD|nr:MAG TPA: hypothetical protein [Siphoviridae sp. ctHMI2]